MHFTRRCGRVTITGLHARSHEQLAEGLARGGGEGRWVASDLSLGAWRGHQVARELCAQLAIDLPASTSPEIPSVEDSEARQPSYADVIGDFIDAEAMGDRATLLSLELARLIRAKVLDGERRQFLIVAPRYGLPWEVENLVFIRTLVHALEGTRCMLTLAATGERIPEVPNDWAVQWQVAGSVRPEAARHDVVGLIPGVISADTALACVEGASASTDGLMALGDGFWLVPPELRREPATVPRLEFDRLGALAHPVAWLDAYAQFHGNNMYVEPWFLYSEARRRLDEGGAAITLRLAERALTRVAGGTEWAIFQSFAQGLRVALHRFAEAGALPSPPATVPPALRGFLLQSKGWGLVMLDQLARAQECFDQAQALTGPAQRHAREYLYLLNISALCRLKAGDVDRALELERKIEDRVRRACPPDRRLQYVNSINIARLLRRQGDLEQAAHYFGDAFATTEGARSDSDVIYMNAIAASLSGPAGRHGDAFASWAKVGLYWAACEAPDAISARVVRFLLGRAPEPDACVPEDVAAALYATIVAAAAKSGIPAVTHLGVTDGLESLSSTNVLRAECLAVGHGRAKIDRAMLASGLSVFATPAESDPHVTGEHLNRLRALLTAILGALAPPGFLDGVRTIVVDDAYGRDMAGTPEALLASCMRLGVQRVALDGSVMELESGMTARLEQGLAVGINPAVETLLRNDDRIAIVFKRYLPPLLLSPGESRLLEMIQSELTLGEVVRRCHADGIDEDPVRTVRHLEQARVLILVPPRTPDWLAMIGSPPTDPLA